MKILKIAAALLGLAALLAAGWAAQFWYARPYSIDQFFERVYLQRALQDPELLSEIRLLEPWGLHFHNDELTDVAPAYQERLAAMTRRQLDELHAYERERLDPAQQLSYDILEWQLQTAVEGEVWQFHNYPLNQIIGVQSELPSFMLVTHQIEGATGAQDYIARLNKFGWKFERVLEALRLREAKGILPPKFVVDKVLAEMRGFVAPPPEQHVLYRHFDEALSALQGLSADDRAALLAQARQAVAESVYPAYGALIAYLETLQTKVTANNGVWALPDGERYYAWEVRRHTTTNLGPEEVHRIGLTEVARIEAEMDAILRAQGWVQGSVGQRLSKLAQDPRFLYPDTDAGRAQILADYQGIIDQMDAGLAPYFDLRPQIGVKVERVPVFKEQTAFGAYYQQPPLDGSKPGIFFLNLRSVGENYRWGMRTLAYHEAIPGHHFQIAIAQTLDLPLFRRLSHLTAYVEGWALYAERLAKEIGYQNDPHDDLGRLQAEMYRAVRLVVDTGLHHKRWTREQAIAYMLDKTGSPESDVVSEIERYMVWPGQALAYKIGMLKLLELRERARQALGERFDIKAFHREVLGGGAMPLTVLEQRMHP